MRVLATFTASFAAGIFLAQYLLPFEWLLPSAAVCFVLACGRIFLRGKTGRRLLLIGVGLALALGWNCLHTLKVQQPAVALSGSRQTVVMTLCEYATPTENGAKATVRAEDIPGKLVYYGDPALLELRPGQTVTDDVYLENAACIREEDVTAFTSKGVFLLAYSRGEAVFGEGSMTSLRWWPARMGRAMQERLAVLFEGDIAAFMTALLTGDKSGLSVQASADLSEAGLYHILAISGMHCGFLLTMVTALAGKQRRRLIAATMIPLLAFYAVLTGGSPSVLRACVMLILFLAAPLFGRESDAPTALFTALFLILLVNPFAAASVSLQMSFAAMAGILWLTPRLYRLITGGKKTGKVFSFIATGISTTIGAMVFTAPLSALYFDTFHLISALSNLMCLWAATLAFIFGLAATAAAFLFQPLGLLIAVLPRVLAGLILAAAHVLAAIPGHAIYFTNPYLKYWLAFLYVLFTAAYLLRGGRRKYVLATVLAAAMLVVTLWLGQNRYSAALDAVVLDVGQGQCVLLKSEDEFALVDCGSANSWYDPGTIASQHLRSAGCTELDYLILTHFDADHTNGISDLLSRMTVETVLIPESDDELLAELDAFGVSVETIYDLRTLEFGLAELTIFPPVGEGDDTNERGLSVLASAGEQDLLLTGDMSTATEKRLLKQYRLPDIEVLMAGHHGSKHSTSTALLDALKPETVCISVGSNNYGHPTAEVLRRLAERACVVYRTDLHGTVRISLND
ncbi:MAG: DNA internalization-related competence protein ComEC/Rec2 [Ruminococcaceae bacterium]|nr:DNA internalization-related competence protein ComEC/Rec2 [Oscillospiraceae bacterium]